MMILKNSLHRVVHLQHVQDFRIVFQHIGSRKQHRQQDQEGESPPVLKVGAFPHRNPECLFPGFHDQLVAHQDQGRQHGKDAHQADQHALGQGVSHVRPEPESHKRQAQQPRESRQ